MSAKYLLPCACGRKLVVEPSQAGETITCPCGSQLEVPSMQAIRQLEMARTRSDQGSEARWGFRQATILLGALLTATALGLALYLHWVRPRLADPHALSPVQTWAAWQELRKGPDRNLSAWDKLFAEAVRDNRRWKLLWLAVAACGTLLMGLSALRRDSRPHRKASRRRQVSLGPREQAATNTLHDAGAG